MNFVEVEVSRLGPVRRSIARPVQSRVHRSHSSHIHSLHLLASWRLRNKVILENILENNANVHKTGTEDQRRKEDIRQIVMSSQSNPNHIETHEDKVDDKAEDLDEFCLFGGHIVGFL